ncbi:MAG: class I SAM-dependent methyltransferase [Bacillota bacterium]
MTADRHSDFNAKKWDGRSETYDKKLFDYFRFIQKKVVDMTGLSGDDNFLDIGCATGWAVCYASTFLKGRGKSYGIDISPGMIEKAKMNSKGYNNLDFFVADSKELPFKDSFFNTIICTNSFHHYLTPYNVLCEIRRVLKPQGMLYILDPTTDGFLMKLIDKRVKEKEKEHVKFYSTKEYIGLFNEAGLAYVKSKRIVGPLKLHIARKT